MTFRAAIAGGWVWLVILNAIMLATTDHFLIKLAAIVHGTVCAAAAGSAIHRYLAAARAGAGGDTTMTTTAPAGREEEGMSETTTPRRICMDRWTPAERAIYDAAQAVEQMPAHPLLTDAVVLLSEARDKVADYVDQHEAPAARAGAGTDTTAPTTEG